MCSHGDGHGRGACSASVVNFDYGSEGMNYNLNAFINKDKVTVLNEEIPDSGVRVFKLWSDREDRSQFVDSDVDEELIFNIPFTGHVKVSGFTLIGDLNDSHPSRVQIFKDRENMSFAEAVESKPFQEMQLKQDDSAAIDYPLAVSKFSDVTHLTFFFPSNFGADKTRLYYIGLRGEYKHDVREKIVIANYEARPVPDDHKAEIPDPINHHVC